MNRRIAIVSLSAAVLLGLAGCTLPSTNGAATSSEPSSTASTTSSADGQSVEDACALIQDTIAEATDEFGKAATEDPAQVVEAMKSAADKLTDAASQVTNEDVAALLPDLQEMFAKTAETMQGIVDGDVSKLEDLTSLGDEFQDTSQRFQELCAPE
ncbi:hypothetical protein G5T42_02235 [Microbacterium sp. 4R-513]|uniref:hypothetical protein n=1 Tax=Microbacterium sp. 4R-513 TaxID=2567934 RepID=UPI0013E1708E|nr:hypothetical protein [Microbacterium sp. 4R-513]QIG38441.1 hypothetical protein G5T42_02235 [Microbacterium sp. 4R-513]